jgi:hypothetical protein
LTSLTSLVFSLACRALIKLHAGEIEKLRKLAQPLDKFNPKEHDDIFLLRYILSNKSAAASIEAVKFCIEYRSEPKNKFWFDKCAAGDALPMIDALAKRGLNVMGFHTVPALDGGPVQLVRQGAVDFEPLLDIWTDEEMIRWTSMQKEVAWQQCDRVTRETGRLVKLIVVNDFKGTPFRKPPSRWMNAFSESSKVAEKIYPQLVETTVMVNTPSWFKWVFSFIKLFLSKRTLEKFKACKGDIENGDILECPYIRTHIAVESTPSYLGGRCECKGGCVPGLSNHAEELGPLPRIPNAEEIEMIRNMVLENRAKEERELEQYLKAH